jgi:glycerol uptake facilitator-like aquaporin
LWRKPAYYITAAYWFTASTSFANPAVAIARFPALGRSMSSGFIVAQLIGAICCMVFAGWLLHQPTEEVEPMNADRAVMNRFP